eukprot:gnl/MRDRNA2_/MRDRNA2_89161_c0_seq1.p1 gnl/MRDRNA2_/MRDRNA2_89161_c0~~gnl/MRDRNA2_/MRDRNA2_89161_c0_seq1.p1  ORF type:complete len:281 (-),score=78.26 gnl/MRDRNA2_/MRDRNA2_89161_c0_seq1:59-901(-)
MQVLLLALGMLAVDGARLVKQRQGPQGLSQECNQELNRLRDPEVQKKSAECEKEGKYPDRVVENLKKGNEANATKLVEEMFTKCASFSEACAAEVAPGLIMEVRFSGVAVSEQCLADVSSVQKDPESQKKAAQCQAEQKVGENILMALNKNDIKGAMDVADASLQKCLHCSDKCAWQLAPVLVNDVVMQAMQAQAAQQQQPQTPQTVVLAAPHPGFAVSPQVLKLAIEDRQSKKVASLLNMAVPKVVLPTSKNLRSPVLLQTSSNVWVSKLLLVLARQQL